MSDAAPLETRRGSDVIVGLMRDSGIEHVALNPGASFRGIHDSIVHSDDAPELMLALHESIAVGMAQGYVKACGKPMGVLLHNVVGLQNASMSIYNAWRDRAPMMIFGGTGPKSLRSRRPWIDWIHTASVQGDIVRDFVVWDNEPHDLYSVPESFTRGMRAATTAPGGPVYLCFDVDLQEDPAPDDLVIPDLRLYDRPVGLAPDATAVRDLADRVRSAAHPILVAGFVGEDPAQFRALIELAESTGAAVIDTGVRHAFPTTHPLCATGIDDIWDDADLIVLLDTDDVPVPARGRAGRVVNVTLSTLRLRSWAQDYQALVDGTMIVADANQVVSAVNAELAREPVAAAVRDARRANTSARSRAARVEWHESSSRAEADGAVALDRMLFEVGESLRDLPFVLANGTNGRLEHRTWQMDEPRQYLGWHSGGGLGYGVPASIGASIALGGDKIVVDIQADGDLLFLPSALWTAARYRTPLLIVVNNNRQYGNTVEHAQTIAGTRGRGDDLRYEAAGLSDPEVDIAGMARSFGVWAAGPVTTPEELRAQLLNALDVVRDGAPALIEVITPGF